MVSPLGGNAVYVVLSGHPSEDFRSGRQQYSFWRTLKQISHNPNDWYRPETVKYHPKPQHTKIGKYVKMFPPIYHIVFPSDIVIIQSWNS